MNARRAVTAALLMVLVVAPATSGQTFFNDGSYHIIHSGVIIPSGAVVCDSLAGDPTTVEIVQGGRTGTFLYVYDSSIAILNEGGLVGWDIQGHQNASLTIRGGIVGHGISLYGTSEATASEGIIYGSIITNDSSSIKLSRTLEIHSDLLGRDESQIDMSGGSVKYDAILSGHAGLTLRGGVIRDNLHCQEFSQAAMSGGYILDDISVEHNSSLTIEGHSFAIDGQPVPYGTYDTGGDPYRFGYLTGVLANPSYNISNAFAIYDNATLTLIPEPSAVLLLTFGGLALIRCRR